MDAGELQTLVFQILDDTGAYYPAADMLAALNEAERLFCLLTLCLETTATFDLAGATAWYHVLAQLDDFLLARRIVNSSGYRLRPATIAVLDSLDTRWRQSPGTPQRYALTGMDVLAVYHQPASADTLLITYAQAPPALVNQTDVPAIRETSHFALANYAAYALRQPEGGQEFSKFLPYLNDFLDEATAVQKFVKAKNLDAHYEKAPFELEGMDRSRLLALVSK